MSEDVITADSQLIHKIHLVESSSTKPPSIGFNPRNTNLQSSLTIPNEPFVTDIREFLQRELVSQTLIELEPALRFVARRGGSNIDALHVQLIKKRSIIIAEDPGLHLVWYDKSIYVKPIPHCLFSFDFWKIYLPKSSANTTSPQNPHPLACPEYRPAAIGLVRTYAYLIQHSSDFYIAQAANLIPSAITYTEFQYFIQPFLQATLVSPRYEYGQIRLTRLDWAVRLCRPPSRMKGFVTHRWYYQKTRWATRSYIESIAVFLVFMFAALSLILSSMQVVLSAKPDGTWQTFVKASWGFSITVIISLVTVAVTIGIGVMSVLLVQLKFALKTRREGKTGDDIPRLNNSA
jgi:hypothetical protein